MIHRSFQYWKLINGASLWCSLAVLLLTVEGYSSCFAAGGQKNIQIVRSASNEVTVEYLPEFRAPATVLGKEGTFELYGLTDQDHGVRQHAGAPEILEKSIPVRLQGTQGNTIEIVQTSYTDVPGVRLAPVPRYLKTDFGGQPVYEMDPRAYGRPAFIPEAIVELRGVGRARGAVLGALVFHPLLYNPATGTVRKFSRIVCRVNFGPPDAALPTPGGDPMNRGIAVNDGQFNTSPRTIGRTASLVNSVLAAGDWFRVAITTDGMYKLTGQQLLALGVSDNIDPASIKIYSNGGTELPDDPAVPAVDDLTQTAIYLSDGGRPGRLDPDDYIIFYGKSVRGWNYLPAQHTFTHYLNHFSDVNYYWITVGGAAAVVMDSVASIGKVNPYAPSTVLGKFFQEDEKVNILSSGMDWLGQTLGPGESVVYTPQLPGRDPAARISYSIHVDGRSPQPSSMNISEHGTLLAQPVFSSVNIGDYSYQISDQYITTSILPNFTGEQSTLAFQYNSVNSAGTGYIDWYEIYYRRHLAARNDLFWFHTADTTAVAQYTIGNFSGAASVFDVSRYDRVTRITGASMLSDSIRFQVQLQSGSVRELYIVGPAGYLTLSALTRIPNQNLHGDTTSAENIIIVHPDFRSAAQRLQTHRRSAAGGGISTMIVDVTQIYNEFGCGTASPQAIRNYLKYRFQNASITPKYVLLFGDGTYDYKHILSSNPNWIPPWETDESYDPLSSYPSDDNYAIFSSGLRVNLGLGRFTCQSIDEANAIVDKIIEYENVATGDPWRLQTTLVADDGLQEPGVNDYFVHTDDAEAVAGLVPELFTKNKIYEYAYPTIFSSAGRRKPEVNQAIDNQINNGTALLNFNGHGNPRLWTHENVFVRETDFPLLHNKGKYFFLVAATCDYSHFDLTDQQSGGELLVSMPNAGAIAVFSATRPVFEGENAALNATLYQNLFHFDVSGRLLPIRLGTLVYITKQVHFSENDRKYFLIGDPAMLMGFPTLTARVDSINHSAAASSTVQLSALSTVSLSATVFDSSTTPLPFNGNALVQVYDAQKWVHIQDIAPNGDGTFDTRTDSFKVAGDILFRGQSSITNGTMSANFIVPKDVSYSSDAGKINIYLWDQSVDGAGYTTNIRIGGLDSTAAIDTQGPQVLLYLDSKTFHSGDVVGSNPTLYADLWDEHGINTSGAGVGHRLEAWLDGSSQSIDLSNYYRAIDSYKQGTVTYPLTSLQDGAHRIKVRAWDTYNNASAAEIAFAVGSGSGIQISNVMNYPNPCTGPTIFTFEHDPVGNLMVTVKIYTVAGRLIQSLEPGLVTTHDRVIRIPWDGRDRDGSAIANGVYLYKIVATSENSVNSAEAYGKLSVVR